VSLLVDTSVWSLAMRRDAPVSCPEVDLLVNAIDSGEEIYSTGIILQELLQGFRKPKSFGLIIERFESIPMLVPDTSDYIDAADIRNCCRARGVQIGTVDCLIAQLSVRFDLSLLTTDKDFGHMSKIIKLKLIGDTV